LFHPFLIYSFGTAFPYFHLVSFGTAFLCERKGV
jgi:hypothetical protein